MHQQSTRKGLEIRTTEGSTLKGDLTAILVHPFKIEVLGKTRSPGFGAKSEYYNHIYFFLFFNLGGLTDKKIKLKLNKSCKP